MEINLNITDSWEGLSGKTVLTNIKSLFEDIIKGTSSLIKDVSVTLDANDTTKFTFTKTDSSGKVTNTVIQVVPQSSKEIMLTNFSASKYVSENTDLTLSYAYKVEEDGVGLVVSTAVADITITCSGKTKTITGVNLEKSYSNSSRAGYITIKSDYLGVGVNTIEITLRYTDTAGDAKFTHSTSENIITVHSYNLNLTVSDNDAYTKALSSDDEIIYTYLLSTTKNNVSFKNYTSDILEIKITRVFPSAKTDNTIETYISNDDLSTGTIQTITDEKLSVSKIAGSTPLNSAAFLAKITFTDDSYIYSNVVKYSYIIDPIEKMAEGSVYYAFNILNLISDISDPTLNKVSIVLYSTLDINIYACSLTDLTKLTSITYEGSTTTLGTFTIPAFDLTNLQLTNIPLTYLVTETGSISITKGIVIICSITPGATGLTAPTDYILSLSANGKESGSEVSTWTYGEYSSTFTGFDWSANGWGNNALILNNDSTVTINCQPCIGKGAKSFVFRYLTLNSDSEEVIALCYTSSCGDGFKIYPLKIEMFREGTVITTNLSTEASILNSSLTTDNIKEVALVWYNSKYGSSTGDTCMIYINGVSLIMNLAQVSNSNTAYITLTSNAVSSYIYNIEAYDRALTFAEVLGIYSKHNGTNISTYALANSIFSSTIGIGNNAQKVTIDSLPEGSLYMLIKPYNDGTVVGPSKPWELLDKLSATVTINGKKTETKSWRILCGNTYLIKKTAKGTGSALNFFADKIAFSALGTSSMGYPCKNFRIYFNKGITKAADAITGFGDGYTAGKGDGSFSKTTVLRKGDVVTGTDYIAELDKEDTEKFKYRLFSLNYGDSYESIATNIFCLKADLAESSGIHNTGFARMANYVLEEVAENLETNTYNITENSYKIPVNTDDQTPKVRSTIDGRPLYLFFAYTDNEGNEQHLYHGKYNLNNEKATEEIFGFKPVDSTKNTEYWEAAGKHAEVLKTLFEGSEDVTDGYYATHPSISVGSESKSYHNPTECWEFSTNKPTNLAHLYNSDGSSTTLLSDNKNLIGAFMFPYTYDTYTKTKLTDMPFSNNSTYANYDPFNEKLYNDSTAYAWINTELAWEMRAPDNDNVSKLYDDGSQPYLLKSVYKFLHRNNIYLWNNEEDKKLHAYAFAKNLKYFFNVTYLIKYYVLTKWFMCADLRIKNCMLAFYYDPKAASINGKGDVIPTSGSAITVSETIGSPMGKMRGYYIFYDNDTILGVNNTGGLSGTWNSKETSDIFLGIDSNGVCYHGIWGNFEYCYNLYINNTFGTYAAIGALGKLIALAYTDMRNKLSNETIDKYLSTTLPDAALNVDFETKYAYPGDLQNDSGLNWQSSTLKQYLGNRKYHREWLLNKRSLWFDALYGSSYTSKLSFSFKSEAATFVPSVKDNLKITSSLDDWRFYNNSSEGINISSKILSAGTKTSFTWESVVNSYTNITSGLYGASKIDLSNYYSETLVSNMMTTLSSTGTCPFLLTFILGTSGKYTSVSDISPILNSTFAPNLTNLTILGTLLYSGLILTDLTKLTDITLELYPNGENITSIMLPKGNRLKTLNINNIASIDLYNKTLLSALSIGTTYLHTINISKCNSLVYSWAFNTMALNSNIGGEVIIGSKDSPDTLTDDQIRNLCKVGNNVKVSGFAINKNLSSLTVSDTDSTLCIELLLSKFPTLIISIEFTTEFTISSALTTLKEGESILINSNRLVDSWTFTNSSGKDVTYGGLITTTYTSGGYSCKLLALRSNTNVRYEETLTITAKSGEDTTTLSGIHVSYVPITTIKFLDYDKSSTITSLILNANTIKNLSIVTDSNTTKNYLLNKDNSDFNILALSGTILAKQYNDSTGILSYFLYTINSTVDTITCSIGTSTTFIGERITATLNVIQDAILYTKEVINNTESLLWLKNLELNSKVLLSSVLDTYISTMAKLEFSNDSLFTKKDNAIIPIYTVLDMEKFLYITKITNFTLPDFPISNIYLPEGLTYFTWTKLAVKDSNGSVYEDYAQIKFPSTLKKALVNISHNKVLPTLQFDLSKTSITHIVNTGISNITDVLDYLFLLLMIFNGTSSAVGSTSRPLFIYPTKTLKYLGTYESPSSKTFVAPSALFTFSTPVDSIISDPINYYLGWVGKSIYIGYLSNLKAANSQIDWSYLASYTLGLYYTFSTEALKECTFSDIIEIGDYAFENNTVKVTIGSALTKIGNFALKNSNGVSITSLDNVTFIGELALTYAIPKINKLSLNLSILSFIGANAFTNLANTELYHSLKLIGNSGATSIQASSFGLSSDNIPKNNLDISSLSLENLTTLRTLLNTNVTYETI